MLAFGIVSNGLSVMLAMSVMSNVSTKFISQVLCLIRDSNWNSLSKYFLLISIITSITKREIGDSLMNVLARLTLMLPCHDSSYDTC